MINNNVEGSSTDKSIDEEETQKNHFIRRPRARRLTGNIINVDGIHLIVEPNENRETMDKNVLSEPINSQEKEGLLPHCSSSASGSQEPSKINQGRWKRRSSDNGAQSLDLPPPPHPSFQVLDETKVPSQQAHPCPPATSEVVSCLKCSIHNITKLNWHDRSTTRGSAIALFVIVSFIGLSYSLISSPHQNSQSDMSIISNNHIEVLMNSNDAAVSHAILPARPTRYTLPIADNNIDEIRKIGDDVHREEVINGEDVINVQTEYPYVTSFLQRNFRNQAWHTCGGVLITPNVILTVAHCYDSIDIVHMGISRADHQKRKRRNLLRAEKDDDKDSEVSSFLQETSSISQEKISLRERIFNSTKNIKRSLPIKIKNLRNRKYFGRAYLIRSWNKIQHPDFLSSTGDFDFMLVKVPGWHIDIQTVKINEQGTIPQDRPGGALGEEVVVLGWGVTENNDHNSLSETLQRAPLNTVHNDACNRLYSNMYGTGVIHDNMICAVSTQGGDACQGDSGGPLLIEHDSDPNQNICVGLVSWGSECGNMNYPGVYSRVSSAHGWITDTVCNTLSPESCTSDGAIKDSFTPSDAECNDHVGSFANSNTRDCAWVQKRKWFACYWYKDYCPATCGLETCRNNL
mmetsp:Transcript_27718/g.32326  ORF Transcript_27718/g.32326 Transcript_27718/m.32326 type:complete len:631 (-) Transcript_27718:10-1902(-)